MTSTRGMLVGLLVGAGAGLAANAALHGDPALIWVVENVAAPIGQIFLRLLFMLVVPLLFSALVMGVTELEIGKLGRVGARTLAYTAVLSTIAVAIGMFVVNVLEPGVGLPDELRELARNSAAPKAAAGPQGSGPVALLVALVPDNVIKAAAGGDMIGLITFSVLFGVGLALTDTEATRTLKGAIAGVYEVSMKLITLVLAVAPIGVAALLFSMTARLGFDVVQQLAAYVGVVLLALGLHFFVVYSLAVRFLGGMRPTDFFRESRVAIATAFSTSSSNATLPTALKVAEENLKVPRRIARFVLTAGATMNQNGTALFEGVTVLFLAQLFGVPLDLQAQLGIMFICILAGIGTAGVPSGSIPVIAMILGMYGIPPEGIGLILGVDRFLDMCRTTLNVTGDLAAAVVISRGEPPDVA